MVVSRVCVRRREAPTRTRSRQHTRHAAHSISTHPARLGALADVGDEGAVLREVEAPEVSGEAAEHSRIEDAEELVDPAVGGDDDAGSQGQVETHTECAQQGVEVLDAGGGHDLDTLVEWRGVAWRKEREDEVKQRRRGTAYREREGAHTDTPTPTQAHTRTPDVGESPEAVEILDGRVEHGVGGREDEEAGCTRASRGVGFVGGEVGCESSDGLIWARKTDGFMFANT